MAKRRMPPRIRTGPNKGRFRKRKRSTSRKRRRNQPALVAQRPRAAPRRRRQTAARVYRPAARRRARIQTKRRYGNPRRRFTVRRVMRDLQDGAANALYILVGKAGARTIHTITGLPKAGNMGLAVQALSAVAVGMVADMVIGPARAKYVLAGGLTAPLETAIVSFNVPFLAPALSPAAQLSDLQGYRAVGSYVRPAVADNGMGRYVAAGAGLGSYVSPSDSFTYAGVADDY